jgi:3-oxoacyl-[acyl-carrier-protein] synthase II
MTRSTSAPVAVTGLGLVTPAGVGTTTTWERVLAGQPTALRHPDLTGLPVDICCPVPDLDVDEILGRRTAWRIDRVTHLALIAAGEALRDAALDPGAWDGARVGVVLGNALGGSRTYEQAYTTVYEQGPEWISPLAMVNGPVNMVAGHLSIRFGALGPNMVVATACASGTSAIGVARQLLTSHACDIVITGASEAPLERVPMAAYARMGALSQRLHDPQSASRPFDADRDGFVAAEGAAILILERAEDARARGAHVHAVVRGYGASADAHHASAPDPDGHGITRAVQAAAADAGMSVADVQHINAHGTSTPLNDLTEGRLIARLYPGQPAVTSAKGVTGHTLGAAGAIEAALTALTVEHGLIPPTANLDKLDPDLDIDVVASSARQTPVQVAVSHSLGFGGQNAALLITQA